MNIICGSRTYRVTDEDVRTLRLAVQHEGAVRDQVAQVLVNCFAYLHSLKPKACPSIAWLVRAYAQPINPQWFPEGKQFKRWNAIDPKKYSLAAAVIRRDVLSKVTKFLPATLAAVDKALTEGPVSIPANATDYAAARVDASKKYQPLTPPEKGVNRLWTRAPKWQGYRVQR
jgi:hypothetical protein